MGCLTGCETAAGDISGDMKDVADNRKQGAGSRKRTFVSDLSPGSEVDDIFFLTAVAERFSKAGGRFIILKLSDRSGAVDARIWEEAGAFAGVLSSDSFARVSGTVVGSRNRLQVNISEVEPLGAEALDQRDFLPSSYRDTGELAGFLKYFLTEVFDEDYRQLLESFFTDASFMEKFSQAPGDASSHHAYLGGLLEHTVSVATLCQHLGVQHPRLDSDLLVTAALLHDIGKVVEISCEGRIRRSREGELLGHVLIGQRLIEERLSECFPGFPREKELKLVHAVISHHGELEWGAPKRPQSAEALALHHLDNLDAKVKGYFEVVEGSGDIVWPSLQNFFRRPLTEPRAADTGPGEKGKK